MAVQVDRDEAGVEERELAVTGMTCGSCALARFAPRASSTGPMRWTFRRGGAIALLLALCLVAAACSGSSRGDGDDSGLTHVHGLGVNPADGELYVASHFGVFRVREGSAQRMGDLVQDTMGFTVAGPDRFLASGHPDIENDTLLSEGMPPLLGLIESTDQGVTWRGLSLQGEVDFHALAYAHDLIYGFDATGASLLVSPDGETWESRAAVQLLSFTVAPEDPEQIVGTTYDAEVVMSDDGGHTWQAATGGPQLTFLSWDAGAGLWALGVDGSVHTSTDGGASWQSRGTVGGQPAALLAHADALYAATADAILSSTDQGATWTVLYETE